MSANRNDAIAAPGGGLLARKGAARPSIPAQGPDAELADAARAARRIVIRTSDSRHPVTTPIAEDRVSRGSLL